MGMPKNKCRGYFSTYLTAVQFPSFDYCSLSGFYSKKDGETTGLKKKENMRYIFKVPSYWKACKIYDLNIKNFNLLD